MAQPPIYPRPATLLLALGLWFAVAAVTALPFWAVAWGTVVLWWIATPRYPWHSTHSAAEARTAPCAPATTGATAGERKKRSSCRVKAGVPG